MHLMPLADDHYAWMLGELPAPALTPRLPEGGIAAPEILDLLRGVAREVGAKIGGPASWLMVVDGEGVGIISVKDRDAGGRWDIGYGVAPAREGRGHATAAVAALQAVARSAGARGLTAETLPDSGASPRVLQRNGFRCTGQHQHPEDGLVDQWAVEWEQ